MQYRVGLVGLGRISDFHINSWKNIPNTELKIVVDTDLARAKSKAQQFGIAEAGNDFQSMVARDDLDIIDIATPHYLHAPYAIAALKANKHVVIEKPVATTLADAEELIRTAQSSKKKAIVAEPVRFSPGFQRASKMITSGEIGDPFLFTTRVQYYVAPNRFQGPNTGWRGDAQKMGGGVLLESGVHNVAAARFLLGDIESVSAIFGKHIRQEIAVEDTISVLFRFKSGATGQGSFSWAARWNQYTDNFTVFGTTGVLGSDPKSNRIFLEKEEKRKEWAEEPIETYAGKLPLFKHFLECIEQNKTPVTDVVEETENLKVVMAAYKSAQENKSVRVDQLDGNQA